MTASDRFVSVAVAGSLSGVTDRTIRRWIASGRLPVVSGPRGRLVDLEDVRRLAALSGHASALDPVNVQIVTGSLDPSRIHVRTELDPDQMDDPDDPQKGVRVTPFSAEGLGELVALVHGKDQQITRLQDERAELYGRLGFYQSEIQHLKSQLDGALAQLQLAQSRILELEAPKEAAVETANHSPAEQNGQDSGSQALSEMREQQPEAGGGSEASPSPAINGREGRSGGVFKRFWRWLTQPL